MVELIDDPVAASPPANPLQTVSLYTNGPFTDLCRAARAEHEVDRRVQAQPGRGRLRRVGLRAQPMPTRIYGTAFFKKAELEEHLERLEQAPRPRPPPPRTRA
jgi:threonyl-tRNA synthetase